VLTRLIHLLLALSSSYPAATFFTPPPPRHAPTTFLLLLLLLLCPKNTYAGFFSQFGRLVKVRVSRSKKTAKAKHYAFLQFAHPDVAAIAAETMDGYFLFKQVRICVSARVCAGGSGG
jgi:hypothetical protein